jgi:hypothetical protein
MIYVSFLAGSNCWNFDLETGECFRKLNVPWGNQDPKPNRAAPGQRFGLAPRDCASQPPPVQCAADRLSPSQFLGRGRLEWTPPEWTLKNRSRAPLAPFCPSTIHPTPLFYCNAEWHSRLSASRLTLAQTPTIKPWALYRHHDAKTVRRVPQKAQGAYKDRGMWPAIRLGPQPESMAQRQKTPPSDRLSRRSLLRLPLLQR